MQSCQVQVCNINQASYAVIHSSYIANSFAPLLMCRPNTVIVKDSRKSDWVYVVMAVSQRNN